MDGPDYGSSRSSGQNGGGGSKKLQQTQAQVQEVCFIAILQWLIIRAQNISQMTITYGPLFDLIFINSRVAKMSC